MTRVLRVLKKKRFYVLIILIAFFTYVYNALDLRYSDEEMIKQASQNIYGYEAEVHHYDTLGRQMRYVEVGDDNNPLLMLIHGAPSSSSYWMSYLQDSFLLSKVKMVVPDRPGYGYSDYGIPEKSVEKQAALLSHILRKKRKEHSKIILHGSSYGGTLASRIAMDYPDLIDGVILQSASTEPGAETTYDISYPTSRPPLSWLVPGALQVANHEKLSHREQLEAMLPFWKNIIDPIIILHGTADDLIHPSNAVFTKEKAINSPLVELIWAEGIGHTLSWDRRNLILKSITKMISKSFKDEF